MVATGFLDLVVERTLGIYDYLSLVPILEGAGALHHRLAGPAAHYQIGRCGGGRRRPAHPRSGAEPFSTAERRLIAVNTQYF